MRVRRAQLEDLPAVEALRRELAEEIPPPASQGSDADEEPAEVAGIVASEVALLAEADDGTAVGLALARPRSDGLATLTDLYVRPQARRAGVATALVRAVVDALRERGVERLELELTASNALARRLSARWGLREEVIVMVGTLAELERRLGPAEAASVGSIHVQSDDLSAVEQAVRRFVPRLPGGSRGSLVTPPRNGWIAVYDDVCDRDPAQLRRLARELSDGLGAVTLALGLERGEVVRMVLLERGRVVDEYLSVPEYYGPLPPGDVVGLQANPTVLARLTGAEPEAVRRVARTASTPAELPPAPQLLAALAEVLGVEGAGHGWADAPAPEGSIRIERG